MGRIYGRVEGPGDIRRINCIIRDEMLSIESVEQLTELKKRSDYLCTLTYSPFWKKKFGFLTEDLRKIAMEENVATTRTANYIARYYDWDKIYNPWGEGEELERELKGLPEEVIKEVSEGAKLKLSPEILEQIRKMYCQVRKAMVFVKSIDELTKLKEATDFFCTLVRTEDFKERFKDYLDKIYDMMEKENERTVKLANIVSVVNGWDIEYEVWSGEEIALEEMVEEYLQRLLEEEEKADKYIPSEAKYGKGITKWITYYHPLKKREYSKRVYFPGDAFDIKIEGPGEFVNRFGRKVWGVKITYKTRIGSRTIERNGISIKIPETVVTRTKVISLPKEAENVRLVDEKPESAYPVA
ncbi:hypothetical protein [Methanotorris igneus]|uniref:Uncharacterized protein n=1 Tax=Methanotorris igneus (strain DSM 5666 / JCM 11834 / Kol 5) TaxID=880724 RepID=F6BEY4_METIK|nr:hypothetical protein [Methanotorris igneus]AEF95720.1 hypothetical protein Metig_0162 [Methanotorris igneus Kol 5]